MADVFSKRRPQGGRLAAASVMLLLLCGCPESEPQSEPDALPFTDMRMDLLVPEGLGLKTAMHSTLEEWSAQSGASCRVIEFAVQEDLVDNIDSAASQDSQLIVFPLAELADYAAAELLQPIPQSQLSTRVLNWVDLFPGLRHSVSMRGEQPTVLPVSCPSLICYYRQDLLDAAELKPPETWADYEHLLEKQQDWTGGLPVVEPWGSAFLPTMFLAHSVAYSKHPANYSLLFDISTGEPLINRPGFVRGLESMQRIGGKLQAASLQMSVAEARRLMLSGQAAMTFAFESSRGAGQLPIASSGQATPAADSRQTPDRGEDVVLGFCRLPGARQVFDISEEAWTGLKGNRINHVAVVGWRGLGIAIRSGASERQQLAACQLLRRLTMEQVRVALPDGTRTLCRHSQMREAIGWVGHRLSSRERGQYILATADSLKSAAAVADFSFVDRERFRAALGTAVRRALQEPIEAQTVLDQLAAEWKAAIQSIGRRKFLDSYRAGLGLMPSI